MWTIPARRAAPFAAVLAVALAPALAPAPAQASPVADDDRPAPFPGEEMFAAFHGREGVDRIVDDLVAHSAGDPRMAHVLRGVDLAALRRALKAELCYVLGGGCPFEDRDAKLARKGRGATYDDFAALVEHLQAAMTREGVAPRAQNRLLARLAPVQQRLAR
ncbi:group 1 truncated hemoglobin [Phenylobacterium sp.]|uniref:group I truncated hemoglobin n=1 Tax=Phenylobacterium sp. TaxID=1871053 RepID=UPI0035B05B98